MLALQKIKNRIKKSKKLKFFILSILYLIEKKVQTAKIYFYLGRTEAFFSNHEKAEYFYKKVISIDHSQWKYYAYLSKNLEDQKKWWQVIEPSKQAIALNKTNIELYLRLEKALEKMNRFEEAIEINKILIGLIPESIENYYRLGLLLEKIEDKLQAKKAYEKVIKLDTKYNSAELGIGIFHEQKGLWPEALNAYKEQIKIKSESALLNYKLGLAYDRTYDWSNAQICMEQSLKIDPTSSHIYFRLGLVYEREHKYEKAAYNYLRAIENEGAKPYLCYRLGYCLNQQGKAEEANNAFQKIETNIEYYSKYNFKNIDYEKNEQNCFNSLGNPDAYFKLGVDNELSQDYISAEKYYELALEREETFQPYLYYRLGCVQNKQKKYIKANESFLNQRVNQAAHGLSEATYFKNRIFKRKVNYTEYYERYKLDKKSILYESYHGQSMSCNPLAIFNYIYEDSRFKDFKHIWVLNDESKIPLKYKDKENIVFIRRNTDLYMRYLAKVKYLINNVTFPEYFIRKESQAYLNTWHGTPIKFLGKDIKDEFMSHKNVTRNFLHTTHLIQPNAFTTDVMLKQYEIEGIYTGLIAKTGYPRQDIMINHSLDDVKNLKNSLGIEDGKTVVLYAPTWRGAHGKAQFNTKKLVEDIRGIQQIENVHFLFRGHHMIEGLLSNLGIESSIVSSDIDTNQLLSLVDILVTDYSSIAFDFLPLNKPIIYYAYDLEEYKKERGLYFVLEDISEDVCYTSSELISSIKKNLFNGVISKKQEIVCEKLCPYDDGKASKRVVDFFFFNQQDSLDMVNAVKKKSLLFYGGPFIPNGITTSFVNLLNHIDTKKYNITVVVEPKFINNFKDRLEQISKINANINFIARVGSSQINLEEKWILDKFNSQMRFYSLEMKEIYLKVFKREFRRIFGYGKYDAIINFEGYNTFWQAVFGIKLAEKHINTIYLHNNMYGEWQTRFPYLKKNFVLYNEYDNLISVSEQTMLLNKDNLSTIYGIGSNKFNYADNIQNPEDIIFKSNQDLENYMDEKIFEDTKVFINIARLSPEKDQEKLIKAFAKVVKKHSEARLINLGSGPLELDLTNLIKQLKIEDKVFLLGQRFNPYPYLRKSDCFVLSSNHEGQPMTLFEALILEKPIIATNITGNRSVLEGRPGLLVDNTENGLTKGMLDFLEGSYKTEQTFNYKEYNVNAIEMFYNKVCS